MAAVSDIRERVCSLVEPILRSEGMELTDLEFKKGRGRWFLRIFIDKEGGVTLDDCADISVQVGQILEVEDVIDKSYILEVSSPGLNRPLKKEEDYLKFSGRLAKISTYEAVSGKKVFIGRLKGLEEHSVVIEEEGGTLVSIPFAKIAKGRLEVEL
jgi:ribosome maturation factor RimP